MNFKTETWIAWMGATVAAIAGVVFLAITFAYGQFDTKDHAAERASHLDKRLERIETKLDSMLNRR